MDFQQAFPKTDLLNVLTWIPGAPKDLKSSDSMAFDTPSLSRPQKDFVNFVLELARFQLRGHLPLVLAPNPYSDNALAGQTLRLRREGSPLTALGTRTFRHMTFHSSK